MIETTKAKIEKGKELEIVNLSKIRVKPSITQINMDLSEIEKGGYPYFMIKEIMEQPKALNLCVNGRLQKEELDIKLSGIIDNIDRFRKARRILISACGTSWHAGLIGKYLFEYYCKIPVEVEVASEFRYRNPVIFADDVMIAISQSGETADTLAALRLAKKSNAKTLSITNTILSKNLN